MKKLFAVIFIVILACLTFVGCGASSGTQNGNPSTENGGGTTVTPEQGTESGETNKPQTGGSDETKYPQQGADDEEIAKMYLTINGNRIEVTLAKNSSVDALVEILKKGDVTYTANDYGGFEKVGSLGHTLPTNNSQITTQAGDVILYSGNQIVLFYGSNSWSYTRLGRINGYSVSELKALLGAGKGAVQVTISLE